MTTTKYIENYEKWLSSSSLDDESRRELMDIADNEKEIADRFYKNLEFGTAGLRGVMGAGTNRMNLYTVRKATRGLASVILEAGEEATKRGVAIAFDSRNNSPKFARECARVLAASGVHSYIYPSLRSTPQLSWTVRHLGCIAGIMITASHNPKEYNGYKCYWEDGGQMPPAIADSLLEIINGVDELAVSAVDNEVYIHEIGEKEDNSYIEDVLKQKLRGAKAGGSCGEELHGEQLNKEQIRIVYTPLYGAGAVPVQRVLRDAGFENVSVVKEQEKPDGNFPTCPYPNPEKHECWKLALEQAENENADLIIATDPDSDRVGVATRDDSGEMKIFTGNEVGVMLTEYVLSEKFAAGKMPQNPAVVSTIVSSRVTERICSKLGVAYFDVYTGFKFIAEKILEFEKNKSFNFVLGWEESIGYLVGTHARDKDAVVASMMIAEMAQYMKNQGKTLWNYLKEIHGKYGELFETTVDIVREGIDGASEIATIMEEFRKNPPSEICGAGVSEFIDYSKLPQPANVVQFKLVNGGRVCVRPSGTEPKIKYYFSATSPEELERFKAWI